MNFLKYLFFGLIAIIAISFTFYAFNYCMLYILSLRVWQMIILFLLFLAIGGFLIPLLFPNIYLFFISEWLSLKGSFSFYYTGIISLLNAICYIILIWLSDAPVLLSIFITIMNLIFIPSCFVPNKEYQ